MNDQPAAIGVIGGSGLYQIEGLASPKEIRVETPFGSPSDAIISGFINQRPIFFLPLHARGHRILPTELNHRANIFALRSLNVRWIISVGAVGSLQEQYHPRDLVCRLLLEKKKSLKTNAPCCRDGVDSTVVEAVPFSNPGRSTAAEDTPS